ncbi:MAG: hypothetical protein PWQ72_2095 [Pseudothermotoga sp.]|nr:hypothetical protein [Pseudothermotoga sp.]
MKPRLKSDCRLLVEGNHGYIYDGSSGNVYVLNALGMYIISLCNGENDIEDIINNICERFNNISPISIKSDVEKFITKSANIGVIEI